MLVLFLPGDLDERLFGFPVLLLELVHHRRVLALNETVQIVSGVAAAMTQRLDTILVTAALPHNNPGRIYRSVYLQISSLHFSRLPAENTEQLRFLLHYRWFDILSEEKSTESLYFYLCPHYRICTEWNLWFLVNVNNVHTANSCLITKGRSSMTLWSSVGSCLHC